MCGFNVTENGDTIIVLTENFSLHFDKSKVGITSFTYQTGNYIHECVESGVNPSILFSPWLTVYDNQISWIYPCSGYGQFIDTSLPWFVKIVQYGFYGDYLNPQFPITLMVEWHIWPSGKIACVFRTVVSGMFQGDILEEGCLLNPASDQDIQLTADYSGFKWFGFCSGNSGDNPEDLSHDTLAVPLASGLDIYLVAGNTNRLFTSNPGLGAGDTSVRNFLLALSVHDSWGDCDNQYDFQIRGDLVTSDITNPDPLNGTQNSGDVITGYRIGTGFDSDRCAYTLGVL